MGICLFESFANQSDFRGVRRLSVRIWDKAVADGNVEQMFGMNIKQEGIEVLGDQVRPPMHRVNDSDVESVHSCETSSLLKKFRMLLLAGLMSGVVL